MNDADERNRWLGTLAQETGDSDKNWWLTLFLSACLGIFGLDRLYLEQPGLAVLKFFTLGGAGLWWFIDLVFLFSNNMRDGHGGVVRRPF